MLSTSDIEGCHTAVAEGMASGAKPVIFDWPGAEDVYREAPIFNDVKLAAEYIFNNDVFSEAEINKVKKYAKNNFDLNITIKAYLDFIYASLR